MAVSQFSEMKPYTLAWSVLLLFISMGTTHVQSVSGRCREDQQSLLLLLKHEPNFHHSSSQQKLAGWNASTDCCDWPGIRCDHGGLGRVISLDLSNKSILGGFKNSTALFSLQYLGYLDLSNNYFETTIPRALANLTNLRYLNLSNSWFYGQTISRLTNLVSLDLGGSEVIFRRLELENPNLAVLVQNLTQLTHLRLDFMDLSSQDKDWSQALSSSLPNLQVLSMSHCFLSIFPTDPSLLKLQSLSVVRLDYNFFSSTVPEFFADLKNLAILNLTNCGLTGTFPAKIFQILSLELIDFSYNSLLKGALPYFPQNHSMAILKLQDTNFGGVLPPSMGNLGNLSWVDVSKCNFGGSIPKTLDSLARLEYLNLSFKNFRGLIPPSLGFVSRNLVHIDLSNNQLEGPIPHSIFELGRLRSLSLSSNRLSGDVQWSSIPKLQTLSILDLSYNNLTVVQEATNFSNDNYSTLSFEKLLLASCNLRKIPELGYQSRLTVLDLSDNNIDGVVPGWILVSTGLYYLNLSHNNLVRFDVQHASLPSLRILDLHDNQLRGNIPSIWDEEGSIYSLYSGLEYLDYSHNLYNGSFPSEILYLKSLTFLSISTNDIRGTFPDSRVYSSPYLQVLDFSSNNFHGSLPQECFKELIALKILNLSHNVFTGPVPSNISKSLALESVDLSHNYFSGQIPKELASLEHLSFLNLSDNNLVGCIPVGTQFQKFDNSSFGGNPHLCGRPLTKSCTSPRFNWNFLSKAFGYVFGLAAVMLPAALWPGFRVWYWAKIDSVILWMFPKLYVKDWNTRLRQRRRRLRSKQTMTGR